MNEISVLSNISFKPEIILQRERLGDHLCVWYSHATLREFKSHKNENKIKMSLIPHMVGFIVGHLGKWHFIPKYYAWWARHIAADIVFANKIANDESTIVYVPTVCKRTIKRAKQRGKKVVLLLANSEPLREHRRIADEYDLFRIKNRYIYGNSRYENELANTIKLADYYINITKVSQQTYADAGYDMSKSYVILDTGTNFSRQPIDLYVNKQKAFISTAFHCFIKGTHRILLAWKKAGIKDIPLIIVGRICEDVEEFIEKYGPFENVIFAGERYDLKEWYKNYDAVGITLSLSEGSGRVTPEMMSYGFPMITSPDAVCDLIVDGYNGSVVETVDENRLVSVFKYYAEDWERAHRMRNNVFESLGDRTVNDYSNEIADYLVSLITPNHQL